MRLGLNGKRSRKILVAGLISVLALLVYLTNTLGAKAQPSAARQKWAAFFTDFKKAVKNRDQRRLRSMMTADLFFSGGGGDDNHNGDTRDEAFQYWDKEKAWNDLYKALQQGSAPMATWRFNGEPNKKNSRVSPPQANQKGKHQYKYYAVFEYQEGKWYRTIFNLCCD